MLVHAIGGRHIALQTAGAPHLWSRLLALIGKPELATDSRFSTPQARRDNWAALQQVFRDWLNRYTDADEAIAALSAARVPVVPMLSPEEVIEHPQLRAREAFPQVPHAARGRIRVTATPFFVDGMPTHPRGPAPYRIGEHTRAVLRTVLGYPDDRIEALRDLGVVELPNQD
jgi:formyl-CoA transferase